MKLNFVNFTRGTVNFLRVYLRPFRVFWLRRTELNIQAYVL